MKLRKKPVVIEAMQYNGTVGSMMDISKWSGGNTKMAATGNLAIQTLEGRMEAAPNDWIIKGVKGEFYPCKPDIFEATYEPA